MRYKYIHFVLIAQKPKTNVWSCRNNKTDEELGQVRWYNPWRQYCFFPLHGTIFNWVCLQHITGFLTNTNTQHKSHPKSNKGP